MHVVAKCIITSYYLKLLARPVTNVVNSESLRRGETSSQEKPLTLPAKRLTQFLSINRQCLLTDE